MKREAAVEAEAKAAEPDARVAALPAWRRVS